jgi:hypothetical protein
LVRNSWPMPPADGKAADIALREHVRAGRAVQADPFAPQAIWLRSSATLPSDIAEAACRRIKASVKRVQN